MAKITIDCDLGRLVDMDKKAIGEVIRKRRRSLKVNQGILAALAGVGINTLVAIERGEGNPSLETLNSVLDTLGLKFDITLK